MAGLLALCLLSLLHPFLEANAARGGGHLSVDAIYSFGDSLADTGNAARLRPPGLPLPSVQFPYGETFGQPTGRFSDGRLMIDYLASALDLPYVPPYWDRSASFELGVNFAVAGATALNQSFFIAKGINTTFDIISLDLQLQWFSDHLKNSVCPSREDCPKRLERALFLVGEIGGNDYNYALTHGKSIEEVKTYVPQVVSRIVDAAKELIDVGAVRLVVPGDFPIGCHPISLALLGHRAESVYDKRNCLKDLNNFSKFHNQHLRRALEGLKKDHPHVTVIYADYYNAFLHILDGADGYGFEKSALLKACCGVGGEYNFDSNRRCGSPGVPACPDPTKFISWDGHHLTQEAYRHIAIQLLANVEPLIIKQWEYRWQRSRLPV